MFEIKRTVGASHIGIDGKLTTGSLVDFLQDCSGFQLDNERTLSECFENNNIGMYLVSRQIDIKRLPEYSEEILIRTWVYECKSMYGYRNTLIFDEHGNVIIECYAIGAFVDLATGKPLKMNNDIISTVPMFPKHEMTYTQRKISIPASEGEKCEPIKVRKYHLDVNNHVNNARYVELAEEFLPNDFERSEMRVRIEYKTPARYGEIITPVRFFGENSVIIKLENENSTFAVIEFSKI